MFILTNKTSNQIGPYNGQTIASNASLTVIGSASPWISDGTLLNDVIQGNVSVMFANKESMATEAAALLIQLGALYNTDSDGASFSRSKEAPAGWTYQIRCFNYTTSLSNSIANNDANNNPIYDATCTFYDSSGTVLTSDLSTCVKTVIDLEPSYDYYLIGGKMSALTAPTSDAFLHVVGVPDYPAPNGSKVMAQNVNLRFFNTLEIDGRAAKGLLHNNPIPHTNKLRFVVYHGAGIQISVGVALELYKL